jgi:hypothetical protein
MLILVDQPTEPIMPMKPSDARHRGRNQQLPPIRLLLVQESMRPMMVEVIDILGQHLVEMTPIDDEDPRHSWRTLTTRRSQSRSRGARTGTAQDVETDRREHRVERARELRVAVADQKPQTIHALIEFNQQVPGCCTTHAAVG